MVAPLPLSSAPVSCFLGYRSVHTGITIYPHPLNSLTPFTSNNCVLSHPSLGSPANLVIPVTVPRPSLKFRHPSSSCNQTCHLVWFFFLCHGKESHIPTSPHRRPASLGTIASTSWIEPRVLKLRVWWLNKSEIYVVPGTNEFGFSGKGEQVKMEIAV